jgi:hypothetical protein
MAHQIAGNKRIRRQTARQASKRHSRSVETPDRNFAMSIDERSARFETYLKPFQSPGDLGTSSSDALKPSFSSHVPSATLAHAEPT